MTGGSLCTGIRCAELAMPWVEWRWGADIDAFSGKMMERHGQPNLGDITASDFIDRAEPVELLASGTPCQAFSVAGRRGSLEDERGNLTLRFAEIADAIDPRIVLWENVPGVLSTPDNAFGCLLGALSGHDSPIVPPRTIRRWRDGKEGEYFAWTDAGVVAGPRRIVAWRLFDAQHFGLAQRRQRVWLVASPRTSGIDPREILFEPRGVRGDSQAGEAAGEEVAGTIGGGSGVRGFCDDLDRAGAFVPVAIQERAIADGAGGPAGSGFRKNQAFTLEARHRPKMVAHAHRGEGFDAIEDGTGRGTPLVAMALNAKGGSGRIDGESETFVPVVASTLGGRMRGQDDATANNVVPVAFNLRGREGGSNVEVADKASLRAAGGGSSRSYVADQWRVRRLTPLECERLQGLPEGYTKLDEKTADGPRYRAIGNGWAINNARWIGERIRKAVGA